MVNQRLQLKLKQQLSMAPQLQQAIRLLQLNRLELREHIQAALDANPLLERNEEATADSGTADEDAYDVESSDIGETEWASEHITDGDWQPSGGAGHSDSSPDAISLATDNPGLTEHLLWQVQLAPLADTDQAIATVIVHALDDDGYLRMSVPELTGLIQDRLGISEQQVESVLKRVQRMEPVGVATRGPAECLEVQLQALPHGTPGRDPALRVVQQAMTALTRGDRELLLELLGDADELDSAIELIESLEPRPGTRYDNRREEFIAPDVYVRRVEGRWQVSLSPDNRYDLSLNRYYISLLKQAGKDEKQYLSSRLQEARWLLSAIEMRNQTLLGVTEAIIHHQRSFLTRGDIAMRPLVMSTIAEEVGVHESTVSRATSRKYVHTPRGLYELKYFFSSHVLDRHGRQVSATAVKARLARLLEDEDPKSPMSDQALAESLAEQGLEIARRTVAKYRQSLGVGSSRERRWLARRLSLGNPDRSGA